MTVDLLANRKRLKKLLGLLVYAQIAINAIGRLALRHMLKKSLELKFWFEYIAFFLNNKYK